MNALEQLKKRAEEAKLVEVSEQLKEKQTKTREMLEAEIEAKEAIIDNFWPEDDNKEQFLNIIDMIADVGILQVEEAVEHDSFCKDQELKDFIMGEFVAKINNLKEETKLKIMKEYEYLEGDRPATSERKRTAKHNIRKIKTDLQNKLGRISLDSYKKARNSGPKSLVVGSVLIPIVCIILGIILRKPIIPILSFVIGWFMFAIWNSKWKHGKIKFLEIYNLMLGGLYLATISIIAGVALHSFLVGLFGVIAGITLFSIDCYRGGF